jgi:hypothetical protein
MACISTGSRDPIRNPRPREGPRCLRYECQAPASMADARPTTLIAYDPARGHASTALAATSLPTKPGRRPRCLAVLASPLLLVRAGRLRATAFVAKGWPGPQGRGQESNRVRAPLEHSAPAGGFRALQSSGSSTAGERSFAEAGVR